MKACTQNPIIIAEGFKGGVGKSTLAVTLVEYCIARQMPVTLIETDKTCPDVGAIYRDKIPCEHVDLGKIDGGGWMKLISFAEAHHEETIVINMSAASKSSMTAYNDMIAKGFKLLQRPVIIFFALGIQKQSVVQLRDAIELFSFADRIVGVKNKHNGAVGEFVAYDNAKNNGEFGHIRDMVLPKLQRGLSLKMFDDDLSLADLLVDKKLEFSEKVALNDWVSHVFAEYDGISDIFQLPKQHV